MRVIGIIAALFVFLVVLATACVAYAAPFMVCNLDNNSRIVVDLSNNVMKLNDSDWTYTQVTINESGIIAEYTGSGFLVGVAYSAEEKNSYWLIETPEDGKASGEAFCNYQEN